MKSTCLHTAALALANAAGLAGAVAAPLRATHPAAASFAQAYGHEAFGFGAGVTKADGTAYFMYGLLGVVVVAVLGFAAWGYSQRAAVDDKAEPLAPTTADAADADIADAEAPPAAERPAEVQRKEIDLDKFFQLIAKRAVHQVGPKLTKANNVRAVLAKHVCGFKQKAMGFLGSELMGTLAQLLKEADAEEVMLLMNPAESLASNIPPLSIMLAGLLSPFVLGLGLIVHLSQVFLVLIPVMVMCAVSIYVDWNTLGSCAVPGLWIWIYTQGVLATVLMVAHLATVVQLQRGRTSIQEKVSDMQGRLNEALADGELSTSEMRELFVIVTILLEHSLVVEDGLRQSPWRKVIGYGTIFWILSTAWTFVLVLGYTFIPGMVAFAESAAKVAADSYCGAWASVLSARLACVLSLFFLMFNIISVVQFLSDQLILSEAWSAQWLGMAKRFDDSMLGLPVVQTIVRAFILRGTADTLRSQIAVAKNRDLALQRQRDELQSKITGLKSRITHHKAEAQALKEVAGLDVQGSEDLMRLDTETVASFAQHEGLDTEALAKLSEEAAKHAQKVEHATKEELEAVYAKILESVAQMREMSAEAMVQAQSELERQAAAAQVAALEGLSVADAAAREAAAAGSAAAADAADRAHEYAAQGAARVQTESGSRCNQS